MFFAAGYLNLLLLCYNAVYLHDLNIMQVKIIACIVFSQGQEDTRDSLDGYVAMLVR